MMDSSLSSENLPQASKSDHSQIDQATEMENVEEDVKTEQSRVSIGSNTNPVDPEQTGENIKPNILPPTSLPDADKIEIFVVDEPLSRKDEFPLSKCSNINTSTRQQQEEDYNLSPFSMPTDGLQINGPVVNEELAEVNRVYDDEDRFTIVEKTIIVFVHNEKRQKVSSNDEATSTYTKEATEENKNSPKGKIVEQSATNNMNETKKVQPIVSSMNKVAQQAISTIRNQKAGPNQVVQIQNKNSINLKKQDQKVPVVNTLKNKSDFSTYIKPTRETFWRNGNINTNRNNKNTNNNNNNNSFNSFKNSKFVHNTNQIKVPESPKSKPIRINNNINKTTTKTINSNNNNNNSKPQSINNKNNTTTNINSTTTTSNRGTNNSIINNKTVLKTFSNHKTNVQTSNNSTVNISLRNSNNSIPVSRTGSRTGSSVNGMKKAVNYFFSENQIDSKTGLLKPTESLSDAMSSVSKLESYQKFEISSRAGSKFKFPGLGRNLNRPREIIHNHIVTKGTYSKTRWSCGYETLTIKHCLYLIFPQNLMNSKDVLTTLKFSSLTSFKNVVQVLRCCPNLIRLAFSNLSLVHKKLILPPDSDSMDDDEYLIELPYLRELQFVEWVNGLTKSEYWLLDFFSRAVTFGRLESFTFAGNENFMSEKDIVAANKKLRDGSNAGNSTSSSIWRTTPNSYPTSSINLSIVWKFLQKNKSIEWLSIGGVGFYLIDDPEKLDSARECLQLTSLRITLNAPGIEYLFRSQKRLITLSCSGFLSSFDNNKLRTDVTDCIQNNWATLDTVRIFPCIITDDITESGEERRDLYSINCECFQKCTRLQSLFLNTTVATQKFTKRMSCGHLLNIHLLPTTLVQIEIYNEEFDPEQLELLLGQKLLQFINLKNLVLSSNSNNLYVVHLPWIQNLCEIESFKNADFFGGRLQGPSAFRNFLENLKNDKNIDISMTLCADCVCFSKFYDIITDSKSNVKTQNQNPIQNQNQSQT